MKVKSVKDTIHGYIRLETPFWKIIDTPEFQRLKWIEQTSYRVLYPSARHDRFIHSIGVYHLGQKAISGFLKNCSNSEAKIAEKYKDSFLLACLLHDIGHAPFSHTCETLYNYEDKMNNYESKINRELITELGKHLNSEETGSFVNDYKRLLSPKGKAPSEHEVMSAIITCRKFDEFSSYFDKEVNLVLDLVIRAILGCTYEVKRKDGSQNMEKGIKNCLIRLLNSSTVDVDKLDYIARDTRMSGFDNIILDTERLLDNVCVVHDDADVYYPAFKKGALSVINNVVIAKNAQAKWIINHPAVIYESYILHKAIGESLKNVKIPKPDLEPSQKKTLEFEEKIQFIFSSKSLSKDGNHYRGGSFSLLSDIELLHMMKVNIDNPYVLEYFSRKDRKKPIWKSHEEFLFYLKSEKSGEEKEKANEVAAYVAPIINYFKNKDTKDTDEISYTKEIDAALLKEIESTDKQIAGKEQIIGIIKTLLCYKEKEDFKQELKFVLLPAKRNFFAHINSKQLFIRFGDDTNDFMSYDSLVSDANETANKEYEFFYMYSNQQINPKKFLTYLYDVAFKEISVIM